MESEKSKPLVPKISLAAVVEGANVKIISIDPDMNVSGRLAELGIYPGETVKIIKNRKKGPVLVLVKDATFMLGRNMAEKIFVS